VNEAEMSQYITDTFNGVDVVSNESGTFFFYNPDPDVPPDHNFPFVTLLTNDMNDPFSDLNNRPSVYRLNIGVSKQTFQSLFGALKMPTPNEVYETGKSVSGFDFTALDQVLPHPVYGRQYWVCVLNPSDQTLKAKVRPLLDEAYNTAVSKHNKKTA
jgi:hypothetical protein